MTTLTPTEEAIADIKSATAGFDLIFSNELEKAETLFKTSDSALHLLGSGACAFLQAALSLEVGPLRIAVVEGMKTCPIPSPVSSQKLRVSSNRQKQVQRSNSRTQRTLGRLVVSPPQLNGSSSIQTVSSSSV